MSETPTWDPDLVREWAKSPQVGVLALKEMADGMPRPDLAKKSEVIDWLMENRQDVLAESYLIERNALANRRHSAQ